MKKMLVGLLVLLGVVLSGCGKTTDESTKTSSESSEQKIETAETTPQTKSSTSSEVSKVNEDVGGVWKATGKEDGKSSTWYINSRKLVVNYVYNFSYMVAENKDPNGYTVVTIKNNEGKAHALLLKGNGNNLEGITVEGEAYDKYLADGTVPNGQLIEFTFQQNALGSMDEAIYFWEKTHKNAENEASKEIAWENYRRDLWSLVKDGTSGNTITLHFTNISGAGGSYDQFVKNDEKTVITFFDGNASYPKNPAIRFTVQNADYKVIRTEELWKH
ncbi:hypothetical protein SAMN05444673_2885 [Bacillus sp. OV166]|uniref:hypothetical protein n=1 Tax=Bacillus sp. OV166 TaxID=1882763 RepID=UPI000A2AAB22|nr:hypothetical protein [Bacillus sp. OV166]SMQ77551.1 hypothetical protein SAMN05444673_2885 [Bacillus sp. OV166]